MTGLDEEKREHVEYGEGDYLLDAVMGAGTINLHSRVG